METLIQEKGKAVQYYNWAEAYGLDHQFKAAKERLRKAGEAIEAYKKANPVT